MWSRPHGRSYTNPEIPRTDWHMDVPTGEAREFLKTTLFKDSMQVGQEPHLAHLFFRARVGLVVNAGQVLKIEVGLNLSGGNIAVPKQFLHRPQVAR